jgi:hypothetical protein
MIEVSDGSELPGDPLPSRHDVAGLGSREEAIRGIPGSRIALSG